MAVDTIKRVAGPTLLTNAAATIYTVPASTTCVLRTINATNTTGTAATLTMSLGADAAGTRIFGGVSIPGNSVVEWTGSILMNAADILQAYSGTASAITVIVTGVENA